MAKKFYDIQLDGTKMTDEKFDYLVNNVLLNGSSHRYQAKKIEYDTDHNYSKAREDMRAAEKWLKEQGYNPIKIRENGDYHLGSANGDYKFHMVWGTYVTHTIKRY